MKCRKMKIWTDEFGKEHRDIVWFGSYGVKKLNGYISLSTIVDYLVSLGYDEDVLGYGIDKDNCNYIDFENKKVVIKYLRVDLGTLSYSYNSGAQTNVFRVSSSVISDIKANATNVISVKYHYNMYAVENYSIWVADNGTIYIQDNDFYDSSKTKEQMVASFKAAMSGVPLVYELANVIEIDISSILTTDEINALSRNLYFKNEYNAEMPSSVTYTLKDGTTQTNTDVAYVKSLPTNAVDKVKVNSVGGITYKVNQQLPQIATTTNNGITFTNNGDGTYTLNGTASATASLYFFNTSRPTVIAGHKYFVPTNINATENVYLQCYADGGIGEFCGSNDVIFAAPTILDNVNNFIRIRVAAGITLNNVTIRPLLFDLTDMGIDTTDVEVAKSELLKRGINIDKYIPYDVGSLRYVFSTSISDNQTKDVDYNKALRANDDYSTKFVAHDNYATEQEGVVNSVIQRLSVIQGELWWQMDYGIPLFSNVSSKAIMDSSIIDMTLEHEDVLEFIDFNSTLENHNYKCNFEVLTTYGNIIVNI